MQTKNKTNFFQPLLELLLLVDVPLARQLQLTVLVPDAVPVTLVHDALLEDTLLLVLEGR